MKKVKLIFAILFIIYMIESVHWYSMDLEDNRRLEVQRYIDCVGVFQNSFWSWLNPYEEIKCYDWIEILNQRQIDSDIRNNRNYH